MKVEHHPGGLILSGIQRPNYLFALNQFQVLTALRMLSVCRIIIQLEKMSRMEEASYFIFF
jgi:hypothetical protein